MDGAADDPTLGQGDASTSNSSTDPIPEHIASLFTLSKLKAISSADDYICELVADTLQEFTIHTGVAPAAEAGRDDLPHSALPTQSLEDNAFGKSEALLRRVERAKADLRKLEVEANKKVDELEEDLVCQDIDYQTSKSELEDSQEELVESFEELDGEVSILSNIAARIGERLETAEVQRKRAEDTVELILYDLFPSYHFLIQRLAAAPLARNLLTLVEGMAGSMGTTTTADDVWCAARQERTLWRVYQGRGPDVGDNETTLLNGVHVGAAVKVCVNAGQLGQAERVLQVAREMGGAAKPNARAYTILRWCVRQVNHHCGCGDVSKARQLLAKMDEE
eukprot:gene17218-20483_t